MPCFFHQEDEDDDNAYLTGFISQRKYNPHNSPGMCFPMTQFASQLRFVNNDLSAALHSQAGPLALLTACTVFSQHSQSRSFLKHPPIYLLLAGIHDYYVSMWAQECPVNFHSPSGHPQLRADCRTTLADYGSPGVFERNQTHKNSSWVVGFERGKMILILCSLHQF